MAFFKFRWPGQGEQAQAEKPSKRPRTPQAESIEVMRRRARHRLIGAAVLVLIGVIGFPMLFDTQPRPIPVDIPIEIPDRNKVAPLVVPAPVAEAPGAAKPSTPSSQDVATAPRPTPQRSNNAVGNGLADGEELVQGSRSAASKPAPAAPAKPEIKPELKPEPKPPVPSEPKPVQRPDEAARARALLEGRSAEPAAAAATAEEARFIVQVGAFADADKAREARTKVERAGMKTYTQVVDTKEGKRTRVRVGPFTNRAEADKAAARIKALDLSASVLTL
ncbi:MAG: sporulation protein [Burkholderiales bacterium RIFCSPHIGHO2_12_FULL_65_48]|nr:MAG: sporulation protein [Burkholderiales bacterium RIFCSPHIGHO2_02_FULL_64_19]OGB11966.1 MAG: sporulation protein [Burkholderiales bacterium RIFCSPHIGHO2_12_FULL_65_48]OGB57820.1 MAG: sporulation protein [Burkholderiales bacterium RIFCSPLOWO2_12_FULL_64_33]